MISATRRRISSMSRRVRHDGGDRLLSSVRIFRPVPHDRFRLRRQIDDPGGLFRPFGKYPVAYRVRTVRGHFRGRHHYRELCGPRFASAAYRTAATRSILIGRYLAGIYATFLVSIPLCIACAYLLYDLAFSGRVALSTISRSRLSDICCGACSKWYLRSTTGSAISSRRPWDPSSDQGAGSSRRLFSS